MKIKIKQNAVILTVFVAILAFQALNYRRAKVVERQILSLKENVQKLDTSRSKTDNDISNTIKTINKLQEQVKSQQTDLTVLKKGIESLVNVGNFQ